MLRVAEIIRQAVAEMLSRGEIVDPGLSGVIVTVPAVQMSPDLKLATIFVAPLGGMAAEALVLALERHKKQLRTGLAGRVNLKFAPDIRFRADRGFEAGARIDALLQSPAVRRDLSPDDGTAV